MFQIKGILPKELQNYTRFSGKWHVGYTPNIVTMKKHEHLKLWGMV